MNGPLDHDLPDLPANLEGFGIAQAYDRFVYVCGGYDQSSPKSVTPACSGCGKHIFLIATFSTIQNNNMSKYFGFSNKKQEKIVNFVKYKSCKNIL